MDPFYLLFAYFCPPGSEFYEQWYTRELHVIVVTLLGMPYLMEGIRTFNFNVINNMIIPRKMQQCLKIVEASVESAPAYMTVAQKLEQGLHMYDTLYLIILRGRDASSFDCLMILGLGYIILMFNAASPVTAWGGGVAGWNCMGNSGFNWALCVHAYNGTPRQPACLQVQCRDFEKVEKLGTHTRNTRCIKKQLAAIRQPIGFCFGDFRPINNEFRLVYLDSVTERTSNQILVYNEGGTFEIWIFQRLVACEKFSAMNICQAYINWHLFDDPCTSSLSSHISSNKM